MTKKSADHKKARSSSRQGTGADSVTAKDTEQEPSQSPPKDKSTERFRRIATVETSKLTALKRLNILKGVIANAEEEREVTPIHLKGKVFDPILADLQLTQKHSSAMCREIGLSKHVRIVLPTPDMQDVAVQRRTDGPSRSGTVTVGVLRSRKTNPAVRPPSCPEYLKGPMCTEKGEIIPHTLLGDVQAFLAEAERRGEFKDFREKQHSGIQYLPTLKPSPRIPWNPLLNEDKALKYWTLETRLRRLEQKRLAGLLHREERQLLMCKSDQYNKKMEQRMIIQRADDPGHLGVCFWKLPERLGLGEILPTWNRSEQGHISTPVISGDADSMLRQKGKTCNSGTNTWFRSEYLHERDVSHGGVIHIANNVLFDKLEVAGEAIYPPKQESSLTSLASGDNGDHSGHTKGHHSTSLNPGNVTQSCQKLIGFDEKDKHESEPAVIGPALSIDGVVLRWLGNKDASSNHSNSIVKETFILIEGAVGEVVRSHVELTNCGTTVIHYNWMKLPDVHPLPVARPKRQPFYFLADEGVILSKQTIHVPLLFRSNIPGYFSQSWTLTTVPEIEGGAAIKFTFKGAARKVENYSQQCLDIEMYLLRNQGRSICELEVRRIVEFSIRKASLQHIRLPEEPENTGLEMMFELDNPGMYYHDNIICRLEQLYKTVTMDINTGRETAEIYSSDNVMSVSKLRQVLMDIPCDEDDDEEEEENEEEEGFQTSVLPQSLLYKFHCEVGLLMFKPIVPFHEPQQLCYHTTYSLLMYGLESCVGHAYTLTQKLGLVIRDEEQEDSQENLVSRRGRKKKSDAVKTKAKVVRSSKTKSTKGMSPSVSPTSLSPSEENKTEPVVHSSAYKYRKVNAGSSNLLLYDEKVYLKMYSMLENTLDTICDLFDHRN